MSLMSNCHSCTEEINILFLNWDLQCMENNGEVREKNERMVPHSGTFPSPFPACTVPHHPEEATLLQGKLWQHLLF